MDGSASAGGDATGLITRKRQVAKAALTRSQQMARVKGANTQPELRLRRALWHSGLRYRIHLRSLPGRPDIVFKGRNVAIFVHGCFWHRHECDAGRRMPKTNVEFWAAKFASNVERDTRVRDALRAIGWRDLVVWECELRRDEQMSAVMSRIKNALAAPTGTVG